MPPARRRPISGARVTRRRSDRSKTKRSISSPGRPIRRGSAKAMPVQAKSELAALLLADDLPASNAQPSSRDDSDKTDFGAALGSLVAAMLTSPLSDATAAKKEGSDSAISE